MTLPMTQKSEEFLASIQELFTEIESWATAKGLRCKRGSVTINEQDNGTYQAVTLQILTDKDEKIAEFVPVGASIIGAKGRVDFVGTIDSVILANWDKGGPSIMHYPLSDGKFVNKVKILKQPVTFLLALVLKSASYLKLKQI